jgi:hypothetical protein
VTPPAPAVPGNRVPAGYRADWALFTDWCDATGRPPLPASARTVEAFLAGCPAAPATAARRVAALLWHYRHSPAVGAAVDPPGRRELLGRPPAAPTRPLLDPEVLAAAVRALPVSGWTGGFLGRRDAALLTLAATPLSWTALAKLRTGDVTAADGVLHLPGGHEVPAADDPRRCPPCVWLRWHRALALALAERSPSARCGPPWTAPSSCRVPVPTRARPRPVRPPVTSTAPCSSRSTSTAIPTYTGPCPLARWPGSPAGTSAGGRPPAGSSPRPCDQTSRRNHPRPLLPRRWSCRAPRRCGPHTVRPWASDGTTCGSSRRSTGFSMTSNGKLSTPSSG